MSVPPALDLQGLLAEDRWIRRLARKLAPDAHAAEDLVQETWAAALGAPRASRPRALRPWLRGILRNLWVDARRTGAARGARERLVARDEALEPASEVVAELELRKAVAEALLALEEPYRGALYLRFFKARSLGAIARAQGCSVTSAHERVRHGLARLRARLDRAHGGRREAWAAGILSLAQPAGLGATITEAIAMASGMKLAASVLVLGGGVAWWWAASDGRAPRAEHAGAPAAASQARERGAGLAPVETSSERAALAADSAPLPAAEPVPAPAAPAPPPFRGRVLDPLGAPLAAVAVAWSDAPDVPTSRSAADGAFELAPGGDVAVGRDPALVTLVPATTGAVGRAENGSLVVAPRADFAGVVVDESGAPVAGASVRFRLRDELYLALGLHRGEHEHERWLTTSDERGAFALPGVAGGERVFLEVVAAGYDWATLDLPPRGELELVVTLERGSAGLALRGIVLDPSGAAVEGARVSAGEGIARTGADGRFEVRLFELPGTRAEDLARAWDERRLEPGAQLVALAAGFAPAREPLASIDPTVEVVLRLADGPASISGVVLDESRAPLGGIVVWLRDPTPFGRELVSMSEGTSVAWQQTVEDELAGGFSKRGATSDARGAFELGGLLPRAYELMAFRPETCDVAGPFVVEAGGEPAELVLPREPSRGRVAGRVLSLGGAPLAGVEVSAVRRVEGTSAHAEPPMALRREVETDAEGHFDLGELALEGTQLHLEDPRLFVRTVTLAEHADPARLELVEPVLCELQIDCTDRPDFADEVRVLDAEGRAIETIESYGNAWSMDRQAFLTAGRSPVLLVRESAETVVLLKGEREVLRRPVRVTPDERTTLRP